jgi:hypothetical protein
MNNRVAASQRVAQRLGLREIADSKVDKVYLTQIRRL